MKHKVGQIVNLRSFGVKRHRELGLPPLNKQKIIKIEQSDDCESGILVHLKDMVSGVVDTYDSAWLPD